MNSNQVAAGRVPGPVTKRLTDAYANLVDCAFVAHYLKHLAY